MRKGSIEEKVVAEKLNERKIDKKSRERKR